ncbi:MAG: hypothetical protein M3Z11_11135 [Candidatus Dormibacteraeota bacterium]|nr:hypothetical protein [Candidatus Dormibacteraeota bacterium]
MSTVHSTVNTMAAAGNLYGWRTDALLLGVAFWALTTAIRGLRSVLG